MTIMLFDQDYLRTPCFRGLQSVPSPESLRVSLGAHSLGGPEDTNHVGVSDIRIHPQYDNFLYDNDFAILTLEKPVRFNKKIQKICLPSDTDRQERIF